MRPTANRTLDAHPNVLHGETLPNTLGGVGRPRPAARLVLPVRTLAAAAAAIAIGLAFVVARAA